MPPKKNEPPPPPPRPPTPPNPVVIAAQSLVEKWEQRVEDITEKMTTTQQVIENLETETAQREATVRSLQQQVVEVTTPRRAEPEPPGKGKKPVKGAPEPPTAPTPDEEELKRQAKSAQALQNLFKKKKENFRVRDTPNDDGSERVEEVGVAKPPEIDEELWGKVLQLRDERINHEDALLTMRSNIETLTSRKESLKKIEQLVAYSLAGAQERLVVAKAAPPPPADAIMPADAAGSPVTAPRPPSNQTKPTNRPPSQLLRR